MNASDGSVAVQPTRSSSARDLIKEDSRPSGDLPYTRHNASCSPEPQPESIDELNAVCLEIAMELSTATRRTRRAWASGIAAPSGNPEP